MLILAYITKNGTIDMALNFEQINHVLLDMDGTLLDASYDNYLWEDVLPRAYSHSQGISLVDAIDYMKSNIISSSGSLNAYCFNYWSDLLQLDMLKYHIAYKEGIKYRPYAEWFLKSLRGRGCQVIILTNADRKNLELKMDQVGLGRYVSAAYSSQDVGYAKEQLQFWSSMQKHLGFSVERTLFIDDNSRVLQAAQQFGIQNLFSISQPAVNGALNTCHAFPLIEDFRQLLSDD
jgi:5'-nucleotidase